MKTTDTILVSYDFTHGRDVGVLIVGRKLPNQSVEIINAFQGAEAEKIYNRLVAKEIVDGTMPEPRPFCHLCRYSNGTRPANAHICTTCVYGGNFEPYR